MKKIITLLALTASLSASADQYTVSRIDQMPSIPSPYVMRDWKAVTRSYVDLVLNPHSGDNLPLCTQDRTGQNYPEYKPLYLDTYVGWGSHGQGSEAINAIPAVVSAYLTGNEGRSSFRLAEGVLDFFNRKNGQNVYLNGFSASSGNDWWYDLMPNVYFYQLTTLADELPASLVQEQYISVADQWLQAVYSLGGVTYNWTRPSMSYRAFNLATQKPLDSGVKEPESAGTIAWILFHAYLTTGQEKYRRGAELAMEYLSSIGSNPAYELQLAYGVQCMAKMNAMLGTAYRDQAMFANCFLRGYLRGWGSIVGTWGGYDVSGLIGEANDKGNDYAFVMNGFQQASALAPAVKYDKRLARAYGRWMVNVANASRLFYVGYLPEENNEQTSLAWSKQYDPEHVIPYESMKETYDGKSPLTMGDAIKGKWATTNLSMYSGSSVGYMAAVVSTTDVEAILQLDLNVTDFDKLDKLPTYLYYNPYTTDKQVTLSLPEGTYRIYDAISESWLTQSAQGTYALSIPADSPRLITLVPASATITTSDNRLYADEVCIDWHVGYDFEKRLRVKNVEAYDAYPVVGETVNVQATVDGAGSDVAYSWMLDGKTLTGHTSTLLSYDTSSLSAGDHTITFTATQGSQTASAQCQIRVLTTAVTVPVITALNIDEAMPVQPGASLKVTCQLENPDQQTDITWSTEDGQVTGSGNQITWSLPQTQGLYTLTCTATTLKGSTQKKCTALVREKATKNATATYRFPFDGSVADAVSGTTLSLGSGSIAYGTDHAGKASSALSLTGNYLYLDNSDALNFRDAVTLSFWVTPSQWTGKEAFVVSHGSWQDRYKCSITPEKYLRWTLKSAGGVVDLDSSTPLTLGEWQHFVAVYTGYSLELYQNGELCAYSALSGQIGTTSNPLTVGCMYPSDLAYNLWGSVDELCIFDYAVTPNQARALYTGEDLSTGIATPNATHTRALYDLMGRKIHTSQPGIFIQQDEDGRVTKVLKR